MADTDPWKDSQPEATKPPKKKMSGCLLASLVVGGLGLVGMLVCCGGAAWFGTKMIPVVTQSPAEVAEVGQKAFHIDIPEDFLAETAITMDNPFFIMRIAQFKHKQDKGKIALGMIKLKVGDPKQADMNSRQFRASFEQEMRGTCDIKSSKSHDITINGQKATAVVEEAKDRNNGKEVRIVSSEFNLPSGQSFIMLRIDEDAWDEDAVLKMLEDIKPPE